MKTLGKFVLCLFQFFVCGSLSLLAVIIQLSALQLLPMMGHFLQILGLQMMKRLQVILLDIVIQGIFQISHALEGLTRLHQS